MARDLQDLARTKEIPFTVLSIDEFHLVAPNDDRLVSTQVLREIARIGLALPAGPYPDHTEPVGRRPGRAQAAAHPLRAHDRAGPAGLPAGIFADAPPEMIRGLPKLPRGTCVLTGVAETVRHATVVDVRRRVTSHGGATPDVFSDLRQRGWDGKKPLEDIIVDRRPRDGG